jgi:hypothetical protein
VATTWCEVGRRAQDRLTVDVSRVQLGRAQGGGHGKADSAGATADVQHHYAGNGARFGLRSLQRDRLANQELTAAARDEDSWLNQDSQAAELGPADYLLQRQPSYPATDHHLQLGAAISRRDEETGLILSENATGFAQPDNYLGPGWPLSHRELADGN